MTCLVKSLIDKILFNISIVEGACVLIQKAWMRKVKIISHFIYFLCLATNLKSEQSSNFPS